MQILNSHRLEMLASNDPAVTVKQLAYYLFDDYKITPVRQSSYLVRVGGFKFGRFSFALMESNAPIVMEARANANHYVMTSCLRGLADLHIDGKTIQMSEGAGFMSLPRRMTATFSSDCVRLVVRLDAEILRDLVLPAGSEFSLNSPSMAAWFGQVQGLLSSSSLMDAVGRDAGVRSNMEELLSALLRSGQDTSPEIEQGTLVASLDVRRAEAFIRSRSHDDISLADIVAAAGVATRTLQNNFMRYRATTPMQYLLRMRLDAAKKRLMVGNEDLSVTDVAFEAGFKHPSRFASFYRAEYGELPSATLRRHVQPKRRRFRISTRRAIA